jgi:hypothetical protein
MLLARLAVHDWLVLGYLLVLNFVALAVARGPGRAESVAEMGLLLGWLLVGIWWARRPRGARDGPGPIVYRVAIYGSVQLSYFFLGHLLPLVNRSTVDAGLYRFDERVFGCEPALLMDGWVTPAATEWFAFFYFSYYLLLALYILPIVLGCRDLRSLSEFVLGMLVVYCVGQLCYMLVPGYGPYQALADRFRHPLPEGPLMRLVWAAVRQGGAMMDIFPSLHTAAPTFLVLYSWRHRHRAPHRYTWPLVAFFALNIIIATMFLRWHYLVDVVVGLALALVAHGAALRITAWETEWRLRRGLGPSWPELGGHRG